MTLGFLVSKLNSVFETPHADVLSILLLSFVVLIVRGDFFSAINFSLYSAPWLILRVLR